MKGILTTESQRHRENENQRDPRTGPIIGAAIEVHRILGPGLLESAYEECLCHELDLRGLRFERQVNLPVVYKGLPLDCGYKLDLVVNEQVVLELKCVEKILPVHEAQLLTYLKLRQACRPANQLQCSIADSGNRKKSALTFSVSL